VKNQVVIWVSHYLIKTMNVDDSEVE